MATPQHKNPCPRGHGIYNFGRTFLVHHNYLLSLSVLCLGVEKNIFKETMHFQFMTYMATPLHKIPCPGVMIFTSFVDPSLVFITIHLVCMDHAIGSREEDF